jgi:DNA-binding NarL/FixJ family response regulator
MDMGSVVTKFLNSEEFGPNCIESAHIQGGDAISISISIGGGIGLIESRPFFRECIRRGMQAAFQVPIIAYPSLFEFESDSCHSTLGALLLSLPDSGVEGTASALNIVSELASNLPVIVFSGRNDSELARSAISHGAKGYIPATMGFDIAIEAVRFVVAGGTYVPMECLLAAGWSSATPSHRSPALGPVTARELAVVRAIRQGKSNKVIAYDLNMCESTVKVHVRNIMKKMKAKNRTDVAIKASQPLACLSCTTHDECWQAGTCSSRAERGV